MSNPYHVTQADADLANRKLAELYADYERWRDTGNELAAAITAIGALSTIVGDKHKGEMLALARALKRTSERAERQLAAYLRMTQLKPLIEAQAAERDRAIAAN